MRYGNPDDSLGIKSILLRSWKVDSQQFYSYGWEDSSRGYGWECRGYGAMYPDLGVKPGDQFSDKVDDFGDEMWNLRSTEIFLISLLGAEIRIYPDDSM
ncbi:hypothetical protein AVEN_41047-1 [Araneus ventricosus]|uniref:Uncharacterized protein n=1 Tax=Araneus ventricosus TaxID=182803 RepID=A0A4Y2CKG5_ARAVE|nr:hypothetical protein AVEN_41047-1 [Araneus ventricosus]